MSNLRQIFIVGKTYAMDHNLYRLPDDMPKLMNSPSGLYLWQEVLLDGGYIQFGGDDTAFNSSLRYIAPLLRCPSEEADPPSSQQNWEYWNASHYAINGYLRGTKSSSWQANQNVIEPSLTCYMSESQWWTYCHIKNGQVKGGYVYPLYSTVNKQYWIDFRHNGGNRTSRLDGYGLALQNVGTANVLYLDGHVKTHHPDDIPFLNKVTNPFGTYFWHKKDDGPWRIYSP